MAFDPHQYPDDNGNRLFQIANELFLLTGDEDLFMPVLAASADCGNADACRILSLYWLSKFPDPYLGKNNSVSCHRKPNYRNAAEYACRHDEKLLMECFEKCQPGELDDLMFYRSASCRNYDERGDVCVLSGDLESCHCKGHAGDCDGWTDCITNSRMSVKRKASTTSATDTPTPIVPQQASS